MINIPAQCFIMHGPVAIVFKGPAMPNVEKNLSGHTIADL